jgi:hypothetical protein
LDDRYFAGRVTRFTRSAVAVVTDVTRGIAGIYACHSNANPMQEQIRIRDYMPPRGRMGMARRIPVTSM